MPQSATDQQNDWDDLMLAMDVVDTLRYQRAMVDRERHCVLTAPHPSPLSAHRGFFGCRHFSAANDYLAAHGKAPIDWFQVN